MIEVSHRLLASIRSFQLHAGQRGPWHAAMRKIARARCIFWNLLAQSDIDPGATFGRNVLLPHPNGVVIHPLAIVGDDCMIMQQVTIGIISEGEAPKVGNKVYVGAGAKILGNITIGDDVRIGANAVVLEDVPGGCTAVGVPARIIKRTGTTRAHSVRR